MAAPARTMTEAERWFRERYCATPERDALFSTISGEPIEPLYTAEDLPDPAEIGFPGEYPYTRGVYPSMYRGRLWTMRQFAGFGTAEEQGVPPERLAGTIQTDILKEYIAQKEWCFPVDPAMRLVTDMIEYCA